MEQNLVDILDSNTNGQFRQMREQFKELSQEDKEIFINQLTYHVSDSEAIKIYQRLLLWGIGA
jgi:catalase